MALSKYYLVRVHCAAVQVTSAIVRNIHYIKAALKLNRTRYAAFKADRPL